MTIIRRHAEDNKCTRIRSLQQPVNGCNVANEDGDTHELEGSTLRLLLTTELEAVLGVNISPAQKMRVHVLLASLQGKLHLVLAHCAF